LISKISAPINDPGPFGCLQSPVPSYLLWRSPWQFFWRFSAFRAAGCLLLIIGVDLMAIGTAAGHEYRLSFDDQPVDFPDPASFVSMVLSGKSGSRALLRFTDQQRSIPFAMNFDKVLRE
jgi:hypothetical protein